MYKHQLHLDRTALSTLIQQEYGLVLCDLSFVQAGEVGQNYILTCQDGMRYFLKLYPTNRLAHLSARRLDFTLALTRQLYDRNLLTHLSYPLPTRTGQLKVYFQGMPLFLYPYIPGHDLMDHLPYSASILEEAARLIAALHNSTPHLDLEFPFVDDFTAHFETDLLQSMLGLEQVSVHHRPGQVALRDLLLPRREELFDLLAAMHMLAERVRFLQPDFVICHTDANQSNLIWNAAEGLFLVDWEGAWLAPAEHDLFIFYGDGFENFLSHYRRLRPAVRLFPEVFAFYFYRRNLEDLADWVLRILHENTLPEQDAHDLDGIQHDCLDGWPYLAGAESRMRVQLERYERD